MNSLTRRTAIGLLASVLALPAMARDTREEVKFAAGKSSARINSVVTGNSVTEYTLGARRGQSMSVTLSGGRSTTYFNVTPPGGDGSAMFIGSSEGNSFSATLPRDGTYLVTVYQLGAAADSGTTTSFTLDISIRGASSATSEPSSGGGGRVAGGYATVAGLSAGDTLNVRSGPSTGNAVVARFGEGRLVQILRCKQSGGQEWCEIAAHSDASLRGWASGRYLKNK
jgi:Bacterial SH3 domain